MVQVVRMVGWLVGSVKSGRNSDNTLAELVTCKCRQAFFDNNVKAHGGLILMKGMIVLCSRVPMMV